MGERSTLGQKPGYNGLCGYAQKITSCFGLDGRSQALADIYLQCFSLFCGTVEGEQSAMPTLPNLNSLGKLCSSSRSQKVDHVRVKRKSSVKRMSIIEDGHVAEVLYLIPKQCMEQMPYLNPNDYYLSERLNDVAT
ncbi:hypothetical protein D4764_11G0002930, partial [Takifugu flavidus]